MKIISHRGGAKLAPENSLEAIRLSKTLGVEAAEIDIHITKDAKLVVFHDYDLKRLAGIDKPVSSLSLTEIKKIQLNNGSKIPTLTEVINEAGDMQLIIEGKGGSWAKLLDKELKKHRFLNKPSVVSFNDDELKKFHDLDPNTICYTNEIFRGLKSIKIAKKNGFNGINIHYLGMNRFVQRSAKKNNLKIFLYTVNSIKRAERYSKHYPEVGLITDIPDKLLESN